MRHLARTLAVLVLTSSAATAAAGWWDDAGAARRASIEDVRKDPDRWRDVTVVMQVRFDSLTDPGNAFFTRFTARDWRAVAVFPVGATPASMNTDEPFSRVFVRRGTENEVRLAAIMKGRATQLRAVVRDSVKGEPWIEILDVVADGDPLTPEETAAAARGDELLDHDNAAAAETIFRGLVARRTLPTAVQAELWRKIGQAAWRQRHFGGAVDAYAACLLLDPTDAATAEALSAARIALSSLPPRPAAEPVASRGAASVAPTAPSRPASFAGAGSPPAPSRHLLPPVGMGDAPAPRAEQDGTKVPVPAPRPGSVPVPETLPVEPPAPETQPEEPPPPPKPKLAGPH